MISKQCAITFLKEETMDREYAWDRWIGTTFQQFKFMSNTKKGNKGEDFLVKLLKKEGYASAKTKSNRRGRFDVKVEINGKDIEFEVKVATQDVNGSHQFNGIRYDREYTHLFCLGITPEDVKFMIIAKQDLGGDNHTMTTMAKDTEAAFKLTKKTDELNDFDQFSDRIKRLGQ